ncbi:MAG: diguanylate cyclase [Gemmatimonadetes bacterium]|nr:diguanylate cyclase [Gemmatimonadota bacterium]
MVSAAPDGYAELRRELGDARGDALLREVTLFLRRNLRGSDAIAVEHDELVLLIDASASLATVVADRLIAAMRGHVFSAGASDLSMRLTLAMGVAPATERADRCEGLLAAARGARRAIGSDGFLLANDTVGDSLDFGRFIGRGEQLARFADYLDDMVRGIGRVVAVVGESGVGASALVRSLQPEVRLRGGSLVLASCHGHVLPAPYSLWAQVLNAIRRLPVKSMRVWRELHLLDPALETTGQEVSGGGKTRLLEELAAYVRLAAQQRPLVVLLEDLQWADAASWDALEYLVSQLESERILLVLTFVSDSANDDALERWRGLAGRPRHSEMTLTRLTRDDAKRWLEGATRSPDAGRELLAYLYRHSEGNPLLLVQLLRDLHEGGHLVRTKSGWRSSPVASLPARADMTAIVERRLGRLTPEARALLDAAAVLGRTASETLLREIAGLPAPSAPATTQELVARGLLTAASERDRPTYAIAHEEIAQVMRDRLSGARRTELHVRVARALADNRAGPSAEIAGHFERGGLRADAHRMALLSADEALALHETGSVAQLLAAAERAAPSEAALAEVRVRMASLAELAGRYEEAETLADLALEWYVAQGDRLKAVQIKRTRALVRIARGKGAADTLTELLALERDAVEAGAEKERGAVLLLEGQMYWRLGDLRSAQRVADEAVAIAERVGDAVLLSDASNRLGATIQFEDPVRARALFNKSFEIATMLGDPVRSIRGLNNLGVLELLSNNWDAARRELTLAREQARTAGLLEPWGRAELNLGVLAGRIGDYDGAARALSEGLRITSMVQSTADQLYATYNMAHVERERGRYAEAADLYELVTELAARIGQVEVQAGAFAGNGLCRFLLGDIEGARRALGAASPHIALLDDWFQGREMEAALQLHLLVADGKLLEAGELFERSLAMAAPKDAYGAAWLTAEFGGPLRAVVPDTVEAALARYSALPEVMDNPKIRERLTVLKSDSNVSIDRFG